MKKAFTLLEMIVVLLMITYLLLVTLKLGWDYIKEAQFKNDKEEFELAFNRAISNALSTNIYYDKPYKKLQLELDSNKNLMNINAVSGSDIINIDTNYFSISSFSGLNDIAKFDINVYELGCSYDNGNNIVYGGDVEFGLWTQSLIDKEYCFKVNLDTCKLFSSDCNK